MKRIIDTIIVFFKGISASERKAYAAVAALFLFLSLVVIAKAILLKDCMAFNTTDDVSHTFTGMAIAKKLLLGGAMPYFNFYNNFGTPLMGDALTYPFGLHAIPYYLTDIDHYPLVMTVNRFVICFATLSALLVLYRTFGIGIASSAVAAIFTFFNFGHFWHFAHHHYQMTLLLSVCLLASQRIAIQRKDDRLLFLCVTSFSALMIYSVSANLVAISFLFFLVHPLLGTRSFRTLGANVAGLAAGALLAAPQIVTTVLAMAGSARMGVAYVDALKIEFTAWSLMLRAFFQVGKIPGVGELLPHVYYAVYFPLSCVLMCLAGTCRAVRDKDRAAAVSILVLGVVPVMITAIFLINEDVWRSVPFLRSTDITRILWLATIFIGIGIGAFAESVRKGTLGTVESIVLLAPMAVTYVKLEHYASGNSTVLSYTWGYITGGLLLTVYLVRSHLQNRPRLRSIIPGSGLATSPATSGLLVLAFILASSYPVVELLGNWYEPKVCSSVNHFSSVPITTPALVDAMKALDEKSRFTMNVPSNVGSELLCETYGRHGAGGRSIVMDGTLMRALSARKLIESDDGLGGYHFTDSPDIGTHDQLGIRYFFTRGKVDSANWELMGTLGDYALYHNRHCPSLVHIHYNDGGNTAEFIRTFRIDGNHLIVHLPTIGANGATVRITMTARPGFIAYVDGKRQPYHTDPFNFIYVDVKEGDRVIRLSYSPFKSLFTGFKQTRL